MSAMITRRTALAGGAAGALATTIGARAETVGVTATTIKIGNTGPYSGQASAYASITKAEVAFFQMVNDQGGVAGRTIDFISLDDGYSPPKTVEDVRRLVEDDGVAFIFGIVGTPTNSAIQRYCNQRKVPQLFIASGASKWNDPKHFPWTMGFQPSYRTEGQIYTKYMLKEKPDARMALLYQNDDFGKDYAVGVRDVLGENWKRTVVKSLTFEVTDATIASQITELQASGADALLVVATPKFAAQAIRLVHGLNWKPMFFMNTGGISVGAVMEPAGPENAVGLISTEWYKDPTDRSWANDEGMKNFKAFMRKYLPHSDISDSNYVYGFSLGYTLLHVLEACGGELSRENIMKQAAQIRGLAVPTLLPGIKVQTSATNFTGVNAMQLARWDGKNWILFGGLIEGI